MPKVEGIAETALYVDDLERAGLFYQSLFGFAPMLADDRMRGYAVPGGQVLLLFKKGGSTRPTPMPGGTIPAHDGDVLHLAFRIASSDADAWRTRLSEQGVTIESAVTCDDSGGGPGGGTSLYFRDPDGHLLELITPGCWAVY